MVIQSSLPPRLIPTQLYRGKNAHPGTEASATQTRLVEPPPVCQVHFDGNAVVSPAVTLTQMSDRSAVDAIKPLDQLWLF